jgi:electron transfer flavoprotein alpha subunit
MLGRRLPYLPPTVRGYATSTASTHALVLLEQRKGVLDAGSLSALSAAQQLGGEVTGLVIGSADDVQKAVESAKKLVESFVYTHICR